MGAREIVDQLSAALVATDSGLKPSGYRRSLEQDPPGGSHRRFEMIPTGGRNSRGAFGDGTTTIDMDMSVRVSYARGGGDMGGGDRRSTNEQAGLDATLIEDCLVDGRNWNAAVTQICEVRFLGWERGFDGPQTEVYVSRFRVEHRVTWPLP